MYKTLVAQNLVSKLKCSTCPAAVEAKDRLGTNTGEQLKLQNRSPAPSPSANPHP